MNNVNPVNRPDISQVLAEMKALKSRAEGFQAVNITTDTGIGATAGLPSRGVQFQALLTDAVDQVNAVQKESGRLAQSFQQGDPNATLTDVVIASEKAGIAFEAMTEVRNRLVNAYEDIMNMPV